MIRNAIRNTKPVIDLDGPAGNAWNLIGAAENYGKQLSYSKEMRAEIIEKMTSGDYTNLVKTFDEYFGDYVILETNQKSLLESLS